MEENGLAVVKDEEIIYRAIEEVLRVNEQSVKDYHAGKTKAMGFLVGQTMKALKGKADPGMINTILREALEK